MIIKELCVKDMLKNVEKKLKKINDIIYKKKGVRR
jgi:hypothetical protein